jgi:hypothetical protein
MIAQNKAIYKKPRAHSSTGLEKQSMWKRVAGSSNDPQQDDTQCNDDGGADQS